MADSSQDRTLPASARKIRKAREEGQVARSRDLGHFVALAVGGAVLVAAAPELAGWLRRLLADALRFDAQAVAGTAAMGEHLLQLTLKMMLVVLPLGVLMALLGVVAAVAAGGWNFTWKAIGPRFSKLDPVAGVARLFSKHQLIDAAKASLMALVLGAVGALYLNAHSAEFGDALGMALPAAIAHVAQTVYGGLVLLVLALALFAAVDVPLQRFQHLQRLKMSHQEVKQEHKDIEGNQEVNAQLKMRMRQLARKRMMAAVPEADLVVMNPTHYAVALKYDEATMAAPRVVAKGADLLALKIRDLANEAKVPVLQAPPLARALYAHAEVDAEIPAALFSAVAQVLAYVYQLRAALGGRGAMPGDLPELQVPSELDPQRAPSAHP